MSDRPQVPTSARTGRAQRTGPRVAFLVLLAAGGTVFGWWALGARDDPSPRPGADAGSDFLVAWERSLVSTYRAAGTFRRTVGGEQLIDDPLVIVQRRPDRITLGFGSWDGVVGGRAVHCEREGLDGPFRDCYFGEPADQEAMDRSELGEIRELVSGPRRRYDTTRRPGTAECFDLVARSPVPLAARFGDRAEVCFDPRVGARRRVQVRRGDAVDLTELTEVRREVPGSDFPEVPVAGP